MKLMSIFALVCTLLCSASLVRGNALGVLFTDSAAANSETQFFTIMNTKWMQNTVQANQITDLGSEGWKQGLRLAGDPDVHFIAWEDIYVNAYHDDILISAEHIVDGNAFNIDMNAVDDVQFVAPRKNTAMTAAHNLQINAGHDASFEGDRNVNSVTIYDDIVTTSGKLTTVYAGVDIDVTGGNYVLADATNGDISMTADQRDIYMQAYDDVKIWAVKQDVLLQAKLRDINICAQQNIRVLSVLDSSPPDTDEGGIIIITGQLLAPGNLDPVTTPDSGKYNIVIASADSEGGGVVFTSATQPALEDVPTPTTRDVYFHAARVDQDDTEGIMFFTTQAGVMPVNQDVVSGRISSVAMATNGAVRFGTFNNAADIKGACASNPDLCPNPNSVDFHAAGGGVFSGNTDQTGGAILVSSSGERDPVLVVNRNILFHAPVSRPPLYPASSTSYLTNGVGGGIGVEISRVRDSVGPLTEEIYVYSNTELQNNHKMGKVQFSTGLPPYQLSDAAYSPGNVLFQSNGPCTSEDIITKMCSTPAQPTSGITIIAGPMGTDEVSGFYPQNDDIIVSAGRSVGEVIVSGGCDVPKSQRRAGDILIHGPTVTGSVQFATGLPLTGTSPDTETTPRDILVTARARTANPNIGGPCGGPHTGVGNVVYATGPVQFTGCDFYDDDGGGNIYYLAGGLNGGISILASDLSSKAAGLGNTPIRGTDPVTKIISGNDDSIVIATDNQDGGIVFNSGTTQFTPTAQRGGITFVAPLADSSIYFGTAQIPTLLLNPLNPPIPPQVTLRNDATLYGVSGGGILIGTDLDTTLEPTDTTIVFAADADTGGISHVVGWTGLPSTPRAQDGSILVNVRGSTGGIGVFTGLLGSTVRSYVVNHGDVVINARTSTTSNAISGAIAIVTSDNFGSGNPIFLSDVSGNRAVDYNVYFNAAADQGGIAINFGVNVAAQDRSIIINADDKRQGAVSFITGTYNSGTQAQSPVDQNDIAFISQFGGIVLGTGDITSTVAFDYKDIKPNDILINAAAANGGVLISAGNTVPVAQSNSIIVANMALEDYITSSTSENGGVLFMTGILPPTTLNTEDICFNTRLDTKGGIVVQTGPGSNTGGNPDISAITNADKNIVFHAQSSPGSIAFDTLPVPVQVGSNTISVSVPSENGAISIAVLDQFNLPAPVDHSISLTTNNKFGELFIATGTANLFKAGVGSLTSCVIIQGGDDNFTPGAITSDIYVVAGKETKPRNAYQTGSLVFQAQHHDGGVVVAAGPISPVAYDNSVILHAPGAINNAPVTTSGIFTQVGTTAPLSTNAILGGFTTVPGGAVVFRTATGNDETGVNTVGKGLGGDILIESSGYNGIVDVRTLQGIDNSFATPVATIRVTSNSVLATTLEGNTAVPFGGDINQIAGGEHFVYADDRLTYSSFAGNLKVTSTLGDVIYQATKGNVQIGATTYQPNFPGIQYVNTGETGSIYIKSDNTLTPPATPDVIFSAKEFNKVYVDGPAGANPGSDIRLLSFAGTIQFASTIDAPAYPQETSTNRDVQFFADNDLTVDGAVCTAVDCKNQAAVSFDALTGTKIASQQGGILFASRPTSQSNPDHPNAGQISTYANNAVVTQASNGILSFTTTGTYEGSDITFTSNANAASGIMLYAGAGAPPTTGAVLVVPNALEILALHSVQMFSVSGHSVDVFNPTLGGANPDDGIRVETSLTGGIGISASSSANPSLNLAAGNIQIYADGRFDVQGNILGLTTPFINADGVLIETNPQSVGPAATITANLAQSMSFLAEIGGILLESTDSLKTRPGDPQPGSDTPEDGQVQINAQTDILYEGQNILLEVNSAVGFQREPFELGHLQLSGRNGVSVLAQGGAGPANKVTTAGDVSLISENDVLVFGLSGVNIDVAGGPGQSVANIEITGLTNGVNLGATANNIAHPAGANLNVVAGNTGSGQGRIDAKAVSGISLTAASGPVTFNAQQTTGSNSVIFAATATPPADPASDNVELHADAALAIRSGNAAGTNGQLEYVSTHGDVSVHTSQSKANINTFVTGTSNPPNTRSLSLTGGVFDVNGDRGAKALTTSRWLTPAMNALGSRPTLSISTAPSTLTSNGGGSDISFLGGGNVIFNAGTNGADAIQVAFPASTGDVASGDYYQLIANAPTQILNSATIKTFGKFENVFAYSNLVVGTAAVKVASLFQGPTIVRGAANVAGDISVTANHADLGLSNWLTDLQGTLTQSDATATGIVTFGRDVLFDSDVNFNANAASLIVKASAVFDPPSVSSASGGTRFAANVLVESGYEFEAQHILTRDANGGANPGKVDLLRGDVVLNQGQFRNLVVPNFDAANGGLGNLYAAFYASKGGDFIGGPGHTESGSHFVTAGHGIFGLNPAATPSVPISFVNGAFQQDFTISAYYVDLQNSPLTNTLLPYPSIFDNFESRYVGIASSALPGKDAFYARRGRLVTQGGSAGLDIGGYYGLPQSSHSFAEANCAGNPNRGCSPKPIYQLPPVFPGPAFPAETMQLPPDTTVGVYLNGNGGADINIGTQQDSINFFGQSIWITAKNWASPTSAYRVADNTAVIPANRDNHWTCARGLSGAPNTLIFNHARTSSDSTHYNYLGTCNPTLPNTSYSTFFDADNFPCADTFNPFTCHPNNPWYNFGNELLMTQWVCNCDASLGIAEFT